MTPTMIAGLRAMAQADESPAERDIARTKLAEAGVPIDPPRPPAPPASAPMPSQGGGFGLHVYTSSGVNVSSDVSNFTITWRFGPADMPSGL